MRIDEIFSFEKGVLQSSKCVPGDFDFITASSDWKTHKEYTHDCEALIFAAAASGSLGRTHYVNGKFVSSDLCFIITPKDQVNLPVDLKFYHILFNELKDEIVRNTKAGTSKEAIGLGSFGKYELPYFDIETQIEIKNQFVNSEETKSSLTTELNEQVGLVKKLRQQLLQDAVQGKLVEQNKKDEPASELLKKIKAEKTKLIAEKKLKKEKELPPIKPEEIPFDIPENWVWCYFGDLSQLINGDRSKNYPNRHEYVYEGYPWINTGHIEPDGTLTKTEMYFITKEKFDSLRSGKIQSDDLVYCLRGATFGKTAFVTPYNRGAIASSLMIIRLSNLIDKKFVYYYLKSDFAMQQLYRFNNGSAQPNLAANDVNRYFFPLPPLSEQNRIVEKLDELMQYCNELETSIKQSESQNEKLLQQVLREALRKEPVEV